LFYFEITVVKALCPYYEPDEITAETRLLGGLRGFRNRVSFSLKTDNCDIHNRNPVSRFLGVVCED
jgi:hypothetical protein